MPCTCCPDHGHPLLLWALTELNQKVDKIMTGQQQAEDLAERIEADVTAGNAAVAAVQAEIAQLQAANPGVDFTSLNSAVAALDTETASVTAAGAEVPPPAPDAPPAG